MGTLVWEIQEATRKTVKRLFIGRSSYSYVVSSWVANTNGTINYYKLINALLSYIEPPPTRPVPIGYTAAAQRSVSWHVRHWERHVQFTIHHGSTPLLSRVSHHTGGLARGFLLDDDSDVIRNSRRRRNDDTVHGEQQSCLFHTVSYRISALLWVRNCV